MQAARRHSRVIKQTLKWEQRALAAPLVVLLGVLTVLLAASSWILSLQGLHAQAHVPPAAAGLLLWTILGTAGFFMPLFSKLQKFRLDAMTAFKAAQVKLFAEARAAIEASDLATRGLLDVVLVRGLAASLFLPPPASGAAIPHLCLTPRLLAQRPIPARVPRG